MKLPRVRFSLRFLLGVTIGTCLLLGIARWRYDVDQNRLRALGPTCYTASVDEPWVWTMSPHVFGAYKWIGPGFLETPMRRIGTPWFDRIVIVLILHDKHVTSDVAANLADSAYLQEIEIQSPSHTRDFYAKLRKSAGDRIKIKFVDY